MDRSRLTKQRRDLYSHAPLIGPCIRRRAAAGLAQAAQDGDQVAARDLAEVLTQPISHSAQRIAAEALRNVRNQSVINTVCTLWQWTRHEALSELIIDCKWVATGPMLLHVLTALKTDCRSLLDERNDRMIEALLSACDDKDSMISQRAAEMLEGLSSANAIERLCLAARHGDERALEVAIRSGYLLSDVRQCVRYPQLAARISERMSRSLKRRVVDIERKLHSGEASRGSEAPLPTPCTIQISSGSVVVTPRRGQSVESVLEEALREQRGNKAG